jgi:hypothetical protein
MNKNNAIKRKRSRYYRGPFTQKTLATINEDSIKPIALAANNQTISTSNVQSPTSETTETKIYYLIDNNSSLNPSPILTSIKTEQNGILIYKVQKEILY